MIIDDPAQTNALVEDVWAMHLSLILRMSVWEELTDPSPLNTSLPPLEPAVDGTPEVRQYLTVIFAHMIHDKSLWMICATPMRYLFYFMRAREQRHIEEMTVGAGGTLLDVCSLLLKCLYVVLADIQSADGDPKWIVQSLSYVLTLV
jgi:hypothetical protein